MASPFGHSLMGLAVAEAGPYGSGDRCWRYLALVVAAAILPDLDFLPGLLIGDVNRFHHGASHSLAAAAIAGMLTWTALWAFGKPATRLGVGVFLGYASHLVLDYFSLDSRPPHGIPVLWPLTSRHFVAPVTPFRGIHHGDPGDPVHVFLRQLFSAENAAAIGTEAAILLPIALGVWYLRHRRSVVTPPKSGRSPDARHDLTLERPCGS